MAVFCHSIASKHFVQDMKKQKEQKIHFIVYVSIIIIGFLLILLSMLNDESYNDMSRNLFSVFSNLGTGLFASGIVVWFLDSMNRRLNSEIVAYKRESLLKDLKSIVQNILNDSANKYFELNRIVYNSPVEPREMPVKDIFTVVRDFEKKFLNQYGNAQLAGNEYHEYIEKLYSNDNNILLLKDIVNRIVHEKDMYIVSGIFSEDEVELFGIIGECADKLHDCTVKKDYVNAVVFIDMLYSNLYDAILKIEQFENFLDMKFIDYRIKNA